VSVRNRKMKFEFFEENGRQFSGPFRAERVFMFTQAKAWAEFSGPFGPSASSARKARASQGFCGPKGHESVAQALTWVRFSSNQRPVEAAEAEFSWPFGPSASSARKARASQGFCGPKGHESIAQALARDRFSSDQPPVGAAEAEFSWPFGPSASPVRKLRASQGFCGPKGHESITQALAWVRFSSDQPPVGAAENGEGTR